MDIEYNIEEIDNGVIIERRENDITQSHLHKINFDAAENEILELLSKLRNNNKNFRLIIKYENKRKRSSK